MESIYYAKRINESNYIIIFTISTT